MGDPACWLDATCPDCGAVVGRGAEGPCPRCGAVPGAHDAGQLVTVGHGTLEAPQLLELLTDAGVAAIVDVRRFPGSRRHPQYARDELARWLPEAGIDYRWEERLGGRRRTSAASVNDAIRNPSFRGYADRMAAPDWQDAMQQVVDDARTRRVAVMCSESVWWRCHRRFIADAAVLLHSLRARHLLHDGRMHDHEPMPEAREEGGALVYAHRGEADPSG